MNLVTMAIAAGLAVPSGTLLLRETGGPIELQAGSPVEIAFAGPGDGTFVTYGATSLPPGARFDPETATFEWTPSEEHHGEHRFTVWAVSAMTQESVAIHVLVTADGRETGRIRFGGCDCNREPEPVSGELLEGHGAVGAIAAAIWAARRLSSRR